jgi:ribosome modulation factor
MRHKTDKQRKKPTQAVQRDGKTAASIGNIMESEFPHMAQPNAHSDSDQQWSLESLNKAYQQGYMAGLTGLRPDQQPYPAEVLAAAWEAGWDDGSEQQKMVDRRQQQARTRKPAA